MTRRTYKKRTKKAGSRRAILAARTLKERGRSRAVTAALEARKQPIISDFIKTNLLDINTYMRDVDPYITKSEEIISHLLDKLQILSTKIHHPKVTDNVHYDFDQLTLALDIMIKALEKYQASSADIKKVYRTFLEKLIKLKDERGKSRLRTPSLPKSSSLSPSLEVEKAPGDPGNRYSDTVRLQGISQHFLKEPTSK